MFIKGWLRNVKILIDLVTFKTLFLYFDSNVVVVECPSGTHYSQDGEDIQKDLEEDYEQQCFYDLLFEQSSHRNAFIWENVNIVSLFD